MTDDELIPRPAEVRRQLELARKRVEALTAQLKVSVRHHGDDGLKAAGPAADAALILAPEPLPATPRPEPAAADGDKPSHPKKDDPDPRREMQPPIRAMLSSSHPKKDHPEPRR